MILFNLLPFVDWLNSIYILINLCRWVKLHSSLRLPGFFSQFMHISLVEWKAMCIRCFLSFLEHLINSNLSGCLLDLLKQETKDSFLKENYHNNQDIKYSHYSLWVFFWVVVFIVSLFNTENRRFKFKILNPRTVTVSKTLQYSTCKAAVFGVLGKISGLWIS